MGFIVPTFKMLLDNDELGASLVRPYNWERYRARLEIIERVIPEWLEFRIPEIQQLYQAIGEWDTSEFATLIGRAVVYPNEAGQKGRFREPIDLWELARIGLGAEPANRGRPRATDRLTQIRIYSLWQAGQKTQQEIADEFDIGIATVGRIIRDIKSKGLSIFD